MLTMQGWWRLLAGLGLVLSGAAFGAAYDPGHWNMPLGVTEISREAHRQHMNIFWICCVIGVIVFTVMIYSIIRHRRSTHPKPADFHESTTVEIIWTIVPFLILVVMAIPAAGALIKMEDVRGADMAVKVTGYQWKWHYEYVDQGVGFYSTLHADSNRARQLDSGIDPNSVPNYLLEVDNRLVLPTQRKVRFLITSNDVLHAWWVPDLGMKKDSIPGFVNEMWTRIEKPGVYRGVCAELCGRDHGFMPIVVEAVEPEVFDRWLAARKAGQPTDLGHGPKPMEVAAATSPTAGAQPTEASAAPTAATPQAVPSAAAPATAAAPQDLRAQGEKVYNTQCVACHQANGQGLPPNFPALAGSKLVNGPADEHIRIVLNGKGLMTPFRHLSDNDIAAVVTYERTAWGNKGTAVQPAHVAAQRK